MLRLLFYGLLSTIFYCTDGNFEHLIILNIYRNILKRIDFRRTFTLISTKRTKLRHLHEHINN